MFPQYFMGFICILFIFNYAVDGRTVTIDNAEIKERIKDAFTKCAPETEDLTEVYRMLSIGKYREDEGFKQLVLCVFSTLGLIYDDGSIDIVASEIIVNDKEFIQNLRSCKKIGANINETNWISFKCFQDTSSVHLQL